ncbi:conserved hypothetical protein [Hahella chejuensis KCTC 2396]|uniref:Uncharacterized protein n=1 Tax=Hahella chejuensis (strain KCTC 2396) TaxID=349521 RepID=Q2SMK5_HAHCH|nr:conserved hypothetical protein [Hahella chejuensis KCTC 2396]
MRIMHFLSVAFSTMFLFINTVFAASPGVVDDLTHSQTSLKTLAASSEWLGLLHFRPDSLSPTGYSSFIDDPGFFLAETGKTDAEAELEETLQLMMSEDSYIRESTSCRFPLRKQWLEAQLPNISALRAPSTCPEYLQWREEVNASQVSLIFPAAYLNSPSSMFGHTFLRFDPADVEDDSEWLSWALNFGATINGDDNSIFFAYRGLAGGYPGQFSMMRYFEKIKEYSYMENRDMWEYRLNLSPHEVERMLMHLWELKDVRFKYYFLDENCAFRLLELLEIARPSAPLTSKFPLTAIPADTVRAVIEGRYVAERRYRPSEAVLLQERIRQLADSERELAYKVATDPEMMASMDFSALPSSRQGAVAQTAYSYTRYEQRKTQRSPELARRSFKLLQRISQLPADSVAPEIPEPPETGHGSTMAAIGGGNRDGDAFTQIQFRYSYHDLLDRQQGYPRGAQIIAGDAQLRNYENDGWELHRFDVINIISQSPVNKFLRPLSWKVQAGFERVWSDVGSDKAYQINAGAGRSYNVTESWSLFGFLTARLEHDPDYKAWIDPAAGTSAGYLLNLPWGFQSARVEGEYFGSDEIRYRGVLEQNFDLAQNHAFRAHLFQEWNRSDGRWEAGVAYRYYF